MGSKVSNGGSGKAMHHIAPGTALGQTLMKIGRKPCLAPVCLLLNRALAVQQLSIQGQRASVDT